MRYFIFLTQEGFTTTPTNNNIENLQVLGIAKGKNKKQAFENLIKENKYLLTAGYDDVICLELKDEKTSFLSLEVLDSLL